ncbi:MAG TPA: biopolymer transporter ExbD [Myxococcota bacterium]|nr:biopolymer transporter ExbD [Myxococcota bacterium]
MQSQRHAPESEDHGIDLAPMLDFMVNLLIFFIITTSFVKEAGITVTKPEAMTPEQRDHGNIMIAVTESGDLWMDRQQVDFRRVRSIVERLAIERPDDSVVIIADKASKAGVVARVMDEVKAGGINEVYIAADDASGGQ